MIIGIVLFLDLDARMSSFSFHFGASDQMIRDSVSPSKYLLPTMNCRGKKFIL